MLIETLPAAFQMDEILYELREHSYGLNAGRWDYIFSMIKCFRDRPGLRAAGPQRREDDGAVHARLHASCWSRPATRRGAFAMGGMAALIPSRKDEEANERAIDAVREDKEREAKAGFDGTWVAHPDVVDVALEAFDAVLGDSPNQIDKQRDDVDVDAAAAARRRLHARARSPRRACATTSTSASSTSRSGSAAAARRGSTT